MTTPRCSYLVRGRVGVGTKVRGRVGVGTKVRFGVGVGAGVRVRVRVGVGVRVLVRVRVWAGLGPALLAPLSPARLRLE